MAKAVRGSAGAEPAGRRRRPAARSWVTYIRKQGVVPESGKGPVVSLAEMVAGEPIRGSWWGHPRNREIFMATRAVRDHADVAVCRLLGGKVTFVHRRLWPALAAVADHVPKRHLARVEERHGPSGRHELHETPFPDWLPAPVLRQAARLNPDQALARLGLAGKKPVKKGRP